MNLSFVDFIEKYLTNPIKLYDYQKEILKNISSNKEPFNFNKIMLKQRQISMFSTYFWGYTFSLKSMMTMSWSLLLTSIVRSPQQFIMQVQWV